MHLAHIAGRRFLVHAATLARTLRRCQVRSMKGPDRKRAAAKAHQYRNDLLSLRRAFDQSRGRAAAALSGAPPGYAHGNGSAAPPPRSALDPASRAQALAMGDASLARTGATLADSRRVLAEAEDIGSGVVGDLEGQRASLLRARDNVQYTRYDTEEAREVRVGAVVAAVVTAALQRMLAPVVVLHFV
jgi:Snare region anchored in the vesicle membrane C-terminus